MTRAAGIYLARPPPRSARRQLGQPRLFDPGAHHGRQRGCRAKSDAGFVMREAMVISALLESGQAENMARPPDHPVGKVSSVQDLIAIYRDLRPDHPLHLGLTEAAWSGRGHCRHRRTTRFLCCRKASATRSAFRALTRLRPRLSPRGAGVACKAGASQLFAVCHGLPRPGTTSTTFEELAAHPEPCASRCRYGVTGSMRREPDARRHGLRGQRPVRRGMRTSASACRAPERVRRRRCSVDGAEDSSPARRHSPPSSRLSSTTTSPAATRGRA